LTVGHLLVVHVTLPVLLVAFALLVDWMPLKTMPGLPFGVAPH